MVQCKMLESIALVGRWPPQGSPLTFCLGLERERTPLSLASGSLEEAFFRFPYLAEVREASRDRKVHVGKKPSLTEFEFCQQSCRCA